MSKIAQFVLTENLRLLWLGHIYSLWCPLRESPYCLRLRGRGCDSGGISHRGPTMDARENILVEWLENSWAKGYSMPPPQLCVPI